MSDAHKPGSDEAVAAGCTCPRMDNCRGKGRYGDGEKYGWWMVEGCPLHDAPTGGGTVTDADDDELQRLRGIVQRLANDEPVHTDGRTADGSPAWSCAACPPSGTDLKTVAIDGLSDSLDDHWAECPWRQAFEHVARRR